MKQFTHLEVKSFELAVKQGATTLQLMEAFDLSRSDVQSLYMKVEQEKRNERNKEKIRRFRHDQIKKKLAINENRQTYFVPDEKKVMVRPPAKYDNLTHEERLNKFLQ